ncbi:hypothetical protein JHK85_003221 [Glycine max]|nr:hypothetical protein JHK85_003221 [Glycine max]
MATRWISPCSWLLLYFSLSCYAEEDPKAWVLKPDMELVCIIYTAIFAMSTRSVVYAWACRKKGPIYVAMFYPLGISLH